MKTVYALFQEKDNKKLGRAFLLFSFFIVISIISLATGIINHETTRIIVSLVGFAACAGLCYLLVYSVKKNSKKALAVKPPKRRK